MDQNIVVTEVIPEVGFLTLNQPERRNALSSAMLAQIDQALSTLETNKGVKVIVLLAAGTVFSAGHDLRELADAPREKVAAIFAACTAVMEHIRLLPKPVLV